MTAENPHDPVVKHLQTLRLAAGEPSYAVIARAVAALRMERGVSEEAALPPRTTVYDAFRLGRRRLDAELVADLTAVLTHAADERQGRGLPAPTLTTPEADPTPVHGGDSSGGMLERSGTESEGSAEATGPGRGQRVVILLLCLIVNFVGLFFMRWLGLPIFLDMIGTTVAAIALGPWWGVLVAFSAAGLHDAVLGFSTLPFGYVAAAGALLWGYGVRRRGAAHSMAAFLRLTVLVGVVCTLLSLAPLYLTLDRWPSHPQARITEVALEYLPFAVAVLISNGFFAVMDKLVTAFVVLGWLDASRRRWPWIRPMLEQSDR